MPKKQQIKKASPKDLIWAGSVQWETGSGSPTYAYVFGIDETTVDTALEHLQQAVAKRELHENYEQWVPWLGQSKKTSPEEIFEGIDESIRVRGPSRHQLDQMWIEGAHMPEVLARIETEPLVVDLPSVSFDDLAPYCKEPEAIRPFVIGGESSLQPEPVWASTKQSRSKQTNNKESVMTHQRRRGSTPKRNTMRKRASAKQIRAAVRKRIEERKEEERPARRPTARTEKPRRRMTASRLEEMRRDKRRKERLATLRQARDERQAKAQRDERLAAIRERREARAARKTKVANLERIRAANAKKSRPAAPTKKEAAPVSTKKQIYVKAGNSQGVPEGYYELDEKATRLYQAQAKKKTAAAKKPSTKKGKKKRTRKVRK